MTSRPALRSRSRLAVLAFLGVLLPACSRCHPEPSGPASLALPPKVPASSLAPAEIPESRVLENGLPVLAVSRPAASLQAVVLVIRGGSRLDGAAAGAASLMADLLGKGTAGQDSSALVRRAALLGGELQASTTRDRLTLSIAVLPDRFAEATALLADVALRPTLDPAVFERLRGERIASVLLLEDDPTFVAERLADRFVFGEGHPYGVSVLGTRRSLQSLSYEDVVAAYARLGPRAAALVTVGPLSTDAARAAISPLFAAWHTAARPPPEPPALSPGPRPRLILVDRPAAPQSVVVVAEPSISRRHPDALAARVANKAIGGAFTSRINESLRERHGLSYGASSAFQLQAGPGAFVAQTAVQTDATARAVKELLGQLDHALTDPLSADELDKARALVAWDVAQGMETSAGAAAAFAEAWAQSLPDDELATFGRRLGALSSASVHRALRGALRPDARTVVVVGDAAAVEKDLGALGLGAPLRVAPDGSPAAPPRSP